MNGEIEQMSRIVICARKALRENKEMDFVPRASVSQIKFTFAPRFPLVRALEAGSVGEWFEICKKRGLEDVKFIIPTKCEQRELLGFANTSRGAMLCYWRNRSVSCFSPTWHMDGELGAWGVIYEEQRKIKLDRERIKFSDHTDELIGALSDIREFAEGLGFPDFAEDAFGKALGALRDGSCIDAGLVPEQLPTEFKRIYYAIAVADVFGAMGSWNDSPAWRAQELGVKKEYDELSDRLLRQIRYHLMYVTNEC